MNTVPRQANDLGDWWNPRTGGSIGWVMPRPWATCFRISLAATLALAIACTGRSAPSNGSAPTGSSPATSSLLPAPDSAIPRSPDRLAARLVDTTGRLRTAIDAWIASGTTGSWPPPDPVVLLALDQQRIYQALAARALLRDAVIASLPADVRAQATDTATAGAGLIAGVTPHRGPIDIQTRPPVPADVLLGYYREAEQRFGVAWEVLAAVNFIESRFGRVVSASSAAARGPMQFLRPTWDAYGMGGDVHDPHDAILGAANYLHASGAPGDYRAALHAYNPVRAYVDAVQRYARNMRQDVRNFYAYYNWQVFVLTRSGLDQLTGPEA